MRYGLYALGALGALALASVPLSGQAPAKAAVASAKSSVVPRTVDGQPDLQGIWDFRTVTPLERPSEFADKPVLTDQEAAEYERKAVEGRNADRNRDKKQRAVVNGTAETGDVALAYNDFWWDRGTKVIGTKRTSLIVDPPDGRIPPLTPEGKQRIQVQDVARERPAWGPEDRSVGERCISGFNSGPPMLPGGYNQNVQIFQVPGYVVLVNEMVHNARVIPTDGRPHLGTGVRQWAGDSRGRWEGNTFIVDTTNFYDTTSFRGSSPTLQLTERFTRVNSGTLLYEFTVTDPKTWTRPWTVQVPMTKTEGPLYEYACHEGNYGMEGLLKGARAVERREGTTRSGSK